MTMIRIDPDEMLVASKALQSVSETTGGVGTGLRASCAGAVVVPATAAQVDGILAGVENVLDTLQKELLLHATLVALRGLLAANDSLAVAGASSADLQAMALTPNAVAGTVGGPSASMMPGAGIIGGYSFTDGIHVQAPTNPLTVVGGRSWSEDIGVPTTSSSMMIIGGHSIYDDINVPLGPGVTYVGGPSAGRNSIASLPPALFNLVTESHQRNIDLILEPSRTEVGNRLGYPITATEYTERGYRGLNS